MPSCLRFIDLSHRVLRQIVEQGAAVVVLNRVVRGVRHVVSDHGDAMRQIARHLAGQGVRGGCCFVGYAGIEDVVKARLAGFAEACSEVGIDFDLEKDQWVADGPEGLTKEGLKQCHDRGARNFVGVNDVAGVMVLQQGRELGLKVPGEIRVTGCDNAPVVGVTVPRLTDGGPLHVSSRGESGAEPLRRGGRWAGGCRGSFGEWRIVGGRNDLRKTR